MDLLATLLRSGGIEGLARQSQLKSKAAVAATEALLPALVGALQRFVRQSGGGRGGLARLLDLFSEHGDGALAAQVIGHDPVSPLMGEDLLDRLFPGEDTDALLREAAKATGLKREVLEKMWPLLAMLVGGYLSARVATSGDPAGLGQFADLLIGGGGPNDGGQPG